MNFIKWRWLYFTISLTIIVPGIVSLFLFGLKPSIDFTGGSLLEVNFTEVAADQSLEASQIRQELAGIYELETVQQSGENQLILRGVELNNQEKNQVITQLIESYGQVREVRFESVGPALGKELLLKTLTGVVIATFLIMLYIWLQFKELKFGVCAILAMLHDSLILLGIFSLLGHFFAVEVDMLFVTALLTTLSLSVHDTLVVFDRIRELRQRHSQKAWGVIINTTVIETLARSINNSVTIIIMLAALAMLGGDTIRWFSLALLIGAITGTYSSTFIAAPLLMVWENLRVKLRIRHRRKNR